MTETCSGRLRRKVPPDDVEVADLLQNRIGNDDGGARGELTQGLHGVHVEINLIGNAEPHRRLGPPRNPLDVEIMIDINVIRGAVAAAGPASEREGGHHVVVNATNRSDGSRRIHNDPPGVDHLAELSDDLIVAREDHRRMSNSAGVIHVDAHLERLIQRFRPIDREHREEFLDGERMFAAYTLDRRDQEFGVGLDRQDR